MVTHDCRHTFSALCISIHTTAKVVTRARAEERRRVAISIHTTAKVVTAYAVGDGGGRYDFNPHHREGGDKHISGFNLGNDISIHTTAKVVTIISH